MNDNSPVVVHQGLDYPTTILRTVDDFGLCSYDLCGPPSRFWADHGEPPGLIFTNVDAARVRHVPSPARVLRTSQDQETWSARSKASLARLGAYFLLAEDPQRRLDAREVSTLAHQVSLVRHILDSEPHLNRVLIADEVGLGKTVEVGLLIQAWLERDPKLRVLYLAPARLVNNVRWELDRLGLGFRQWSASPNSDGRLDDPRLVASIHRAVHSNHVKKLLDASRCDVLVVDECHHLTAWGEDGADPTEKYRLVRDLIARQGPDAKVVFLSGTPHRGNSTLFSNLLDLLRQEGESDDALAGRVIFRTKDDVRDWNQHPLFPSRQIAAPIVVDLGPDYRIWIEQIRDFFSPPDRNATISNARRRSAGWRCAQALQWAASSPQAGLGYLVRQAIRAGWTTDDPIVHEALAAIRPYRMGPADEPIGPLFDRIRKEIERQRQSADLEDIETLESNEFDPDVPTLGALLSDGIRLIRSSGDEKWLILKRHVLDPAGPEKIVLFAQPIETVTALAGFLQRTTGERPSLIIGGQDDATRQREIERFRDPDGARYLVSSKAGGEGINLQVARRLVHLDIPWNPMDLEQRVGRVHRFGSRETILVDTLIVKDSRESDAYRVARQKLEQITQTLVDPEKFESLFSRVMSLIPPEEFADLVIRADGGYLSDEQQQRLAGMVRRGYQDWDDFHRRFAEQQQSIRTLNPGLAGWDDVRSFLEDLAGAVPVDGFRSLRFTTDGPDGRPVPIEGPITVLKLGDGTHLIGEEHDGMPVRGPIANPNAVRPMGLNVPVVAETLRRVALSKATAGAAHLRWTGDRPPGPTSTLFGVVILVRQTLRAEGARWVEQGLSLHAYHVDESGASGEWTGADRGAAIRGLLGAVVRREPAPDGPLNDAIIHCEAERLQDLRLISPEERERGQRHAIIPLLAAIVAS